MVHMPSLEIWEWDLKIFCGVPTLTTHVDQLLFTNKQTQSSKPCAHSLQRRKWYIAASTVRVKNFLHLI